MRLQSITNKLKSILKSCFSDTQATSEKPSSAPQPAASPTSNDKNNDKDDKMSKPIVLYSHKSGPNPWKVAILLEELGLPYKTEFKEFSDLKVEPFVSLNPNGRVPAIEDPNTGIVVAESGAILQYLVDTYDKSNALHATQPAQKYAQLQWLHFQMSGQGPYFGQKAWFSNFHAEKLPSAEARYEAEIKRVVGVIDAHLAKKGTKFLTGDDASYADLAWVTWNALIGWLIPGYDPAKEYPRYAEWNKRLQERPAVAKVLAQFQGK